jgi:hypothetical protein
MTLTDIFNELAFETGQKAAKAGINTFQVDNKFQDLISDLAPKQQFFMVRAWLTGYVNPGKEFQYHKTRI